MTSRIELVERFKMIKKSISLKNRTHLVGGGLIIIHFTSKTLYSFDTRSILSTPVCDVYVRLKTTGKLAN